MYREGLFVLALVVAVLGHDIEKRSRGCNRLFSCVEGLDQEMLAEVDTLTDSQVLDEICNRMEPVKNCFRSSSRSCYSQSTKQQVKAVVDVIEYICSDEGKAVVLEIANSPCATDESLQLEVQVALQGCMETFQSEVSLFMMNAMDSGANVDPSDMCPYIDGLKGCMQSRAGEYCGAGFSRFVGKIWDISAGDQFAAIGCSNDIVAYRRAITDIIPVVLKRSAEIAKRRK